jgi:hypothetical protein
MGEGDKRLRPTWNMQRSREANGRYADIADVHVLGPSHGPAGWISARLTIPPVPMQIWRNFRLSRLI